MPRSPFTKLHTLQAAIVTAGLVVIGAVFRQLPHHPRSATSPSVLTPTAASRVMASYGRLPLRCEMNVGQTDARVKLLCRATSSSLFLTNSEAVLMLARPQARPTAEPAARRVLRLQLIGSNPAPRIEGQEPLPGRSHYFLGNNPRAWRTHVPAFAAVRYAEVFPGIDLKFYGIDGRLEYDFLVKPGAQPTTVALALRGAERMALDRIGHLILDLAGERVTMQRPVIYQELSGGRRMIPGGYVLKGAEQIGFQVAAYDHSRPLIIDPILSYSTYVGGSGAEGLGGITVDGNGNAYITGPTDSSNFPTVGAPQPSNAGSFDVFIAKLNPTGSALVYATYLGGSSSETGTDIALDASGNAYVTGQTTSTNFPTVNAFEDTFQGGSSSGDGFVVKLSPDGATVLYATYLGGTNEDRGLSIAVDAQNSAYIGGETASTDFPLANALQATHGGSSDAFVTKMNALGSTLDYSTYVGGIDLDRATGIAVDGSGNAYLTGETGSADFPTANAFQDTLGQASMDAFISKLNATGTALVYSTYLGGTGNETGEAIAVDGFTNVFVTGETDSTDFPTANALQASLSGTQDAFVTALNTAGSALLYSTYLGGSSTDRGMDITADASGVAYVAGDTSSTDFPTASPFQSSNAGNADAFVVKLNTSGSALTYASYLGGSCTDRASAIAIDSVGSAYVAGSASSSNFPTVNPFQSSLSGVQDAFVSKIAVTLGQALTDLGPAAIWIGLKNSDDVGIKFDLRAEVYRNGTQLIGSGELASVAGGSSGFNNANEQSIALTMVPGVEFFSGDTVGLKLLVRNACSGSGKNSGRARLWYNDSAANSRLDIEIDNAASTDYLIGGLALSSGTGSGPKLTVDVAAGAKCSAYKSFGTWTMTVQ